MDIDSKFIDVDFPSQPEFVYGNGGLRSLDSLACRSYADFAPLIPEAQWPELAEKLAANGGGCSALVTRIYNQKNEGSCVGNAKAQQNEIIQATQKGKENVVPLSAISMYKRIGSSPNSGAMIDDALEEGVARGYVPLDTPENRAKFGSVVMPPTGFYTPFPANWQATAALFKDHEFLVVRSVAELITALFNLQPVVVGRQGHSICYCDPVYRNGSLHVAYANSWGNWGFAMGSMTTGFGLDTLGQIRMSASWAFAVRSSVVIP
jgi:hypothetical protein